MEDWFNEDEGRGESKIGGRWREGNGKEKGEAINKENRILMGVSKSSYFYFFRVVRKT
jgi:hypothetical protein